MPRAVRISINMWFWGILGTTLAIVEFIVREMFNEGVTKERLVIPAVWRKINCQRRVDALQLHSTYHNVPSISNTMPFNFGKLLPSPAASFNGANRLGLACVMVVMNLRIKVLNQKL
jgi:hypothetical protein